MRCPRCKSDRVTAQVVNEVYAMDKHHGFFYWILIAWWWLPVKWLCFTMPALLCKLFVPKKQRLVNRRTTVWVCQHCGKTWRA